MKVSDYMTSEVVTANLRDGLYQTFERMIEREIRHMPVLDDDEALVGIVSERDLRRPDFVDQPGLVRYYALDNHETVEHAMSTPVTVRAGADVTEALDLFIDRKFGALPVLDDDGQLVGILSTIDALRAFRDRLEG